MGEPAAFTLPQASNSIPVTVPLSEGGRNKYGRKLDLHFTFQNLQPAREKAGRIDIVQAMAHAFATEVSDSFHVPDDYNLRLPAFNLGDRWFRGECRINTAREIDHVTITEDGQPPQETFTLDLSSVAKRARSESSTQTWLNAMAKRSRTDPAAESSAASQAEMSAAQTYVVVAICTGRKVGQLWTQGTQSRQPELRYYGYAGSTGIRAVSAVCDTVPGTLLGEGLYVYRGVRLKENRIATVYRRLDEANRLQDLRILVPESNVGSYCNTENTVVESMKRNAAMAKAVSAGMAAAKAGETPQHPFASAKSRNNYWSPRRGEFEAIGFVNGSADMNSILLLCEQATAIHTWDDGMTHVEITAPNGENAPLLWWPRNGKDPLVRAIPSDQEVEKFRQKVLELENCAMKSETGKRARSLHQEGGMTWMNRRVAQSLSEQHGSELKKIVGGTGDRDTVRFASALCDGLKNDPEHCIDLGGGVTHFIMPQQGDELAKDGHILRWAHNAEVFKLLPFFTGGLDTALADVQKFISQSEATRAGRARKKERAGTKA